MDLTALPGGDLVQQGLADLGHGVESVPALLVSIGAPRLRRIGLPVPATVIASPEHRLYEKLAETGSDSAHSRYNALVRRLVSFESAAECGAAVIRQEGSRKDPADVG
jgi:hypothetical protein